MRELKRLQQRFDQIAIDQLREEVTRLAKRLDEVEQELHWVQQFADNAQHEADTYREAIHNGGGSIGLQQNGDVVVLG